MGAMLAAPDDLGAERRVLMLRMEYIDRQGTYRIYRMDSPNTTVAYETDYYKALAIVRQGWR